MRRVAKAGAYSAVALSALTGSVFMGYNLFAPGDNSISGSGGVYDRSAIITASERRSGTPYVLPNREKQFEKLDEAPFDMLVIGGGATGSGAALDGVSRGLRVALVEKNDFSQGTSSRATKMAHGGVRYLEKAILRLDYRELFFVYECLKERKHFFQVAPHLASGLPIITPCYSYFDTLKLFIGLRLYDMLSGYEARIGKSELISASRTRELYPTVNTKNLKASMIYNDAVFNDARVNMSLAMTAAALGGTVVNHAEVVDLVKDDKERVTGALVRDLLTGTVKQVRAKVVINATGCFVDRVRRMDDKDAPLLIRGSIGTHVAFDKKFGSLKYGLLFPKTSDGRVLFLVPWEGKIIAGTTDESTPITETPSVSNESVDFIVKHVQKVLTMPVDKKDVLSAWSGIRPLVVPPSIPQEGKKKNGDTKSIPRDHYIETSKSGLVTVTGGKWTSFRRMAEDAVDTGLKVAHLPHVRSESFHTVLIGGEQYHNDKLMDLSKFEPLLGSETCDHLKHYYGDRAIRVAQLAAQDKQLAQRLHPSYPHVAAEVLYQVDQEYARKAIDVIAFRSNLMMLDKEVALRSLPKVVELMSTKLNWSEAQKKQELHDAEQYISKCTM